MNTSTFKKLATFEQGARISNGGLTIDNGGITVTAGLSYLKGGLKVGGNSGNGHALDVTGSGKFSTSLTASTLSITSASLSSISTNGGIQAANTIQSTGGDVISNQASLNATKAALDTLTSRVNRCIKSNGTIKVDDSLCSNPTGGGGTGPSLALTCTPSTCQDHDFNTGNSAFAQVIVNANFSCSGTCTSPVWTVSGTLGSGSSTGGTSRTYTLSSTSCGYRTKSGTVTVSVTDNATGITSTKQVNVTMSVETGGC